MSFNSIDRVDVALAASQDDEPQNFLIVGSDTRELKRQDASDNGAIFGGKKEAAPGGQRADTMVIARVDPTEETVELLSIPRDLWVDRGSGKSGRINAAYNDGPQELIDTVKRNTRIPINHYIEVNFDGFKGLVEAIGGVPMYFDRPMYDNNTGLRVKSKGCVNLNPTQALAFARSRHLYYSNGKKWVSDPTGDLGRITRQQVFIKRAMQKVATLGLADVGTIRKLIDAGTGAVTIDDELGIDEMMSLAKRFKSFDSSTMVTHRLPTIGFTTDGGAAVLRVDDAPAAAVMAIFSGTAKGSAPKPSTASLTAGPLTPTAVTVDVANGAGTQGLAKKVSSQLGLQGFLVGAVTTAEGTATTELRHAPGDDEAATLVGDGLAVTPRLVADPSFTLGRVSLILGRDFQGVSPTATTTSTPPSTTTTTAVPAGPTTTVPLADREIGFSTGDPPPGVRCG